MAQQVFNFFERRAIWEAYNKRCGHCCEPLSFATLEIDHIIPEYLKNSPADDWEEIRKNHTLPVEFNIFGYENLVASCAKCNSKKSGMLLQPGVTGILLSIATRERPKIENLVDKFKRNNKLDRLRFALGAAVDSGSLTPDQIPQLLLSAKNKNGTFKLSTPFPIFGESEISELSQEKYEEYLDSSLVLPEWLKDGLPLEKDGSTEIFVKSLREYQSAVDDGFYPLSNAAMKSAYAYFIRPLSLLGLLLKAKLAENSYIDDPRRGLADIELLPASLLFSLDSLPSGEPDSTAEEKTIADLVIQKKATIVQVGSDLVYVEYQDHWTFMFELMRADVNGDGIQELIIHWGGGPTQGTLFVGDVKVLARASDDEKFQLVD